MKEGRYIMLDVKDLYKESYIGKEITVSGWIKVIESKLILAL